MGAGVLYVIRKRLARKRGAFGKPALLTGDGRQIIGCIGVVWIGALHFGVNRRRLGNGAAPMQR